MTPAASKLIEKFMSSIEITEIILVYCYLVNTNYQHDFLYIFVSNKTVGLFLKRFGTDFTNFVRYHWLHKKSATEALKITLKRAVQKIAEGTGNWKYNW